MNSALLNEATKLSIPERIELVEAIWDSVAAGIDALPLSEEHRFELDRRLADLEADPKRPATLGLKSRRTSALLAAMLA